MTTSITRYGRVCPGFFRLSTLAAAVLCSTLAGPSMARETDEARVDALLKKMTLDDKFNLIRGMTEADATNQGQAGYLPGVPRLGVPALRMADGPPGILTRKASIIPTSTMGLAATFSKQDAFDNGTVIGEEAKRLGIDVALEPFINMFRDSGFRRGWNTYGEDPLLTGRMGAELIKGIQGQGVMAQAKHLVGYDMTLWFGMWAPAQTPPQVVRKLNESVNAIVGEPKVKEQFAKLGILPAPMKPEDFGRFVRSEIEVYRKIVRAANIQPQ